MAEDIQHFDCLIIGAGICGIDAAYHVQKYSPWANYAVLERGANVGGTWDFVKYPGRFQGKILFLWKKNQTYLSFHSAPVHF